ncbi:DUF262 domain-containing HNH endonuclease family protein [Hyphomicrobium sp.]|uniref:DUF262 domain-containing protein n=1 Tax=Hyphomicrobium sp. TaxID=82 RepID=UPI0025BB7FF8|nr:DUF262 domain-containing HNH endonuclease family protein [Hyphomicrobium sp.]MCC7252325.1 DUF262 domain-containing protein [Hyphomicrobium sp.]
MHELISVSVLPLKDLFSDAFHFRLPYFQRAYAWQTAEVGRLLSDITAAMRTDGGKRGYFLGKLMVAQRKGQPDTALVDGHQRIMTLTLLFAVLRDLESDPVLQERLNGFIRGREMRLTPQEAIAPTCERFVQAPGATSVEPDEDFDAASESERNLIENRNYLRTELSDVEFTPELRHALIDYLAERCWVIVSSVEDEDEAWAFLRTEEETRVDFSKSDRAKFNLLSIVPAGERTECQKIWESCEALLGATDMHALLGHLRTLKRRKQTGKPVEVEIAESYKFNVAGAGSSFLKAQLQPAAERLAALRRSADNPFGVGEFAERLKWIDMQLWVPAALLWLQQRRDAEETQLFFRRLERLVWTMKIAGFDPTKQHNRIVQLLGEIDRGGAVGSMRELDVTAEMREKALSNLRSPSFDAKHFSGRVLRRISIALGQDPGPIERDRLTIEHVLPRAFAQRSGWRTHFPTPRSVKQHAHRLGNLTFLSPEENQKADAQDWVVKRPILAGSQFLLSRRLADVEEWSPAQIFGRTEDLIRLLFKEWEIKP